MLPLRIRAGLRFGLAVDEVGPSDPETPVTHRLKPKVPSDGVMLKRPSPGYQEGPRTYMSSNLIYTSANTS